MSFSLGEKSLTNLGGVHPQLVAVVKEAIELSKADFTVYEGLRSLAHQAELVAAGASKTMSSKHLVQIDGFGHAVDLVPWVAGQPRWEWGPIYHIARAVRQAATNQNVELVWGGVWDRTLNALTGSIEDEVKAYSARHPGPDFLDGPHFQLK